MKECSFHPKIQAKSTSIALNPHKVHNIPIYQWVDDLQRDKEAELQRLRMEKEENDHLSFKPKVDQISAKLA